MAFNSFNFIFLFFPVFFIVYRLLPARFCAPALCVGGLVFCAIGLRSAPLQLLPLVGITLFGMLGCALFRKKRLRKKGLLALWIARTAAPLACVKLSGLLPGRTLALPLGLSFYTFQTIAFLVYAWQGGKTTALGVAAGTLMFPKLISGPLTEPEEILAAVAEPKRNRTRLDAGLEEFILGLGCKLVVADHLAGVLGQIRVRGVGAVSVPLAWLGVLAYALQLYFDFWGYSQMAVGLGKMLGLLLPENFDHPYCATSVAEFWRRWHMSLGSWFRDYVYFPLGGSRVGRGRLVFNLAVVWFLTGLWHGANWTFILWGCLYGVLIAGEKLSGLVPKVEGSRALRLLYQPFTMVMVVLGWVLFRAPSIGAAGSHLAAMFGAAPLVDGPAVFWSREMVVPFACAVVGSAPVLKARLLDRVWLSVPGYAVQFALFIVSISCLVMNAHNPFIYFNF